MGNMSLTLKSPVTGRRLTARLAGLIGVTLVVISGCAPEEIPEPEPISTEITVAGTGDDVPTVTFEKPFPDVGTDTEVLWNSQGARVEDGEPVLLRLYAVNGATGEVERNDFESVPGAYRMDPNEIGTQMYEGLKDLGYGSRIKLVSPLEDTSLITIIDVFAAFSTGIPNTPESMMPTVTYGADQAPTIQIPKDLKAPQSLQVQQLKTGCGSQVNENDRVVLQFVGVGWSSGEIFDTTWGPKTLPVAVTVGADSLIQGLDETLVGVPIGSQLMVVVPPDLGFGPSNNELAEETLVYVIDVLAASAIPAH